MIRYLEWDSLFFEQKIGFFEIPVLTQESLENLLKEKLGQHYDLIYLSIVKTDADAEKFLIKNNIPVIDRKVTYVVKEITKPEQLNDFVKPYHGILSDKLLQLAFLSGHESRFKKDPVLSNKFEALYKQWIEKSISGEMANVVLVACVDDDIKGFVTVKKKNSDGQIGLIAVAPSCQGQNMGSKLIMAAHDWYYKNNITSASVVTQQNNIAACRLYEKMGYIKESTKLIYHL